MNDYDFDEEASYQGLAIVSLVFAFLFPPLALVLGIIALYKISYSSNKKGKTQAAIATIMGGLYVAFIAIALLFSGTGTSSTDYESDYSYVPPAQQNVQEQTDIPDEEEYSEPAIGDTVQGYQLVSISECSSYSYKKDGYEYATFSSPTSFTKYCGERYAGISDATNHNISVGDTYQGYHIEQSGTCPYGIQDLHPYEDYYEVSIDGATYCATK